MNGLVCDNCGTVLRLDARNGRDDELGERAAWISLAAGGRDWDCCSRSCATALLDDGTPLAELVDAHLEAISEIARTIREGRDDDD